MNVELILFFLKLYFLCYFLGSWDPTTKWPYRDDKRCLKNNSRVFKGVTSCNINLIILFECQIVYNLLISSVFKLDSLWKEFNCCGNEICSWFVVYLSALLCTRGGYHIDVFSRRVWIKIRKQERDINILYFFIVRCTNTIFFI